MTSSKKNIYHHAISMVSSGAVQAVVAFISNLICVRYISPSEFGTFALIVVNATLLSAFFNFRIGDLILRSSDEELSDKLNKYSNFTLVQSFCTTIGGGLLLYLGNFIHVHSILVLVSVAISPFVNLQLYLLERRLKYFNIALIESSSHLTSHLIVIVGVLIGWGPLVLYLRILVQPIFLYIGLLTQKSPVKLQYQWASFVEIKTVIKDGKWIWVDNLFEQMTERFIIIFANSFISLSALGFFFQAKRLAVTPHQLLQPFTTRVLLNHFSKSTSNKQLLKKILIIEVLILVSVLMILFFFGRSIIVFLLGSSWEQVVDVLFGLFGVVGFLTIFNTIKAFHIANKSLKAIILWGRLGLLITFITSLFIFYFYFPTLANVMKLAYSISIGYFVATLFLYLNLKRIPTELNYFKK